jgi:hypothetical protein
LPEKLQAQSKAPYHPQMASYQSREVSAIYCKVEQASRLLQTVDKVQLNLTPLTETRSMAVEMAKSLPLTPMTFTKMILPLMILPKILSHRVLLLR